MEKKSFFFLALLTLCLFPLQSCVEQAVANAPKTVVAPKSWIGLEEAVAQAKVDQKKIIVDVYTDWCRWCKVMDDKTFKDPAMAQYLKANFHTAKFNAEQKTPITFNGQSYEWVENGRKGHNQLAPALLDGQLAYPSLVIFDAQLNKLQIIRGFKTPEQLLELLEEKS